MIMEIGLSFGSNIGDRLANLSEAKARLLDKSGATLVAQSPIYDTEPVDVKPEYADDHFLNSVVILESDRGLNAWSEIIQQVEADMGRQREDDRNAPRSIDVDLLYAGESCIDSGGLIVPHPRWANRRFVVQPLADVRPNLVMPGTHMTVAAILASLPQAEGVEVLTNEW